MNNFFKSNATILLLLFSLFLCSCGTDNEPVSNSEAESKTSDDTMDEEVIANYRKKVNKKVSKSVTNSAIRELGEFGVSETQVKCLLKDTSYVTLATKKNTPEVQAVFEGCGVDVGDLKDWGR